MYQMTNFLSILFYFEMEDQPEFVQNITDLFHINPLIHHKMYQIYLFIHNDCICKLIYNS